MSLSISSRDRDVLARCQLSNQIIAIDRSQPGGPRLETIDRRELNCWDVFISLFGFGRLASKSISLHAVTNYLNQYSWKTGPSNDPAYINVCALANRALMKGSMSLFYSVSHRETKSIELVQFVRGGSLNAHAVYQPIFWNPALQVKHVRAQLSRQFLKGNVEIKDGNFRPDANSYLTYDRLKQLQVIVRQDMTPEVIELPRPENEVANPSRRPVKPLPNRRPAFNPHTWTLRRA